MHMVLDFLKKKRAGKCLTPHCRNAAQHQRNFCITCRCRKYDDPRRRLFRNLKASAKRRGKEFALEFETFVALAEAAGYLDRAGRERECLHVDRIDPRLGYVEGNIQFLTCGENVRKAFVDRKILSGDPF